MKSLFLAVALVLTLSAAKAQNISPPPGGLTAGSTPVSGCTTLQLFYNNAGTFGCMAGTSWDDTNRALTLTGATLTDGSKPIFTGTQTWNNGATVFEGFLVDITNSASALGSRLFAVKSGGTLYLNVRADGRVDIRAGLLVTVASGTIQFRSGGTTLSSPATDTLQLGLADAAAPTAQTLGVQNVVAGTSNTAGALWTQKGSAGTGTGVGGNIKWQVALAGGSGTAQNSFTDALTLDASAAVPRITAGGPIKRAGYAIASLPTGSVGDTAYVTDQLTACPALGGTFTNGGNVVCSAFFDGSAWTHQ